MRVNTLLEVILSLISQTRDPRKNLEIRSPNLGPYTTKGTLWETPFRDVLFGSSRGSGLTSPGEMENSFFASVRIRPRETVLTTLAANPVLEIPVVADRLPQLAIKVFLGGVLLPETIRPRYQGSPLQEPNCDLTNCRQMEACILRRSVATVGVLPLERPILSAQRYRSSSVYVESNGIVNQTRAVRIIYARNML